MQAHIHTFLAFFNIRKRRGKKSTRNCVHSPGSHVLPSPSYYLKNVFIFFWIVNKLKSKRKLIKWFVWRRDAATSVPVENEKFVILNIFQIIIIIWREWKKKWSKFSAVTVIETGVRHRVQNTNRLHNLPQFHVINVYPLCIAFSFQKIEEKIASTIFFIKLLPSLLKTVWVY